MGLQKHTHEMTWCVALSSWMLLYFVTYLQDGLTKAHAWDDMMRCVALSSWMLLYFVTYLQDGLTKAHAWDATMRCSLELDAFVFCNIFARWAYKSTRMRWHESSLWRTKKSHFRPSDEIRMKKVDKDAVITTIGPILLSRCMKILKMNISVIFKNFHASR